MSTISIGTGVEVKKSLYSDLQRAGILSWAKHAVDISIDASALATEENLRLIFRRPADERPQYFRIQTSLHKEEAALDNPDIIEDLINEGLAGDSADYRRFIECYL